MPKRAHNAHRLHYSLLDQVTASPTEPLPKASRDRHMTILLTSLEAIAKSPAPKMQDFANLTDPVNILDTFAGMEFRDRQTGEGGYTLDIDAGIIRAASTALVEAFMRHKTTGQLRLSGPGLAAVREAFSAYAQLVEQLPARVLIKAWRDMAKEMQQAAKGARDPKTIVLEV